MGAEWIEIILPLSMVIMVDLVYFSALYGTHGEHADTSSTMISGIGTPRTPKKQLIRKASPEVALAKERRREGGCRGSSNKNGERVQAG